MPKYLTPSEAIKELNNLKLLRSETSDGYILVKKKSKAIYEIKVFTNNKKEPDVYNGAITNVLKTFNNPKLNAGFYVVN